MIILRRTDNSGTNIRREYECRTYWTTEDEQVRVVLKTHKIYGGAVSRVYCEHSERTGDTDWWVHRSMLFEKPIYRSERKMRCTSKAMERLHVESVEDFLSHHDLIKLVKDYTK